MSLTDRDPEVIPDGDIAVHMGKDFFFDEKIPRHESCQGYVRVVEHSVLWKENEASKVFTYQGLTTCTEVNKSWTTMSGAYNHVRSKRGKDERSMAMFIRWKEVEHQELLEAAGYRSPTWRMLRAQQSLLSATQLPGESAVAAPLLFPNADRGSIRCWGKEQGPTVFLWDGLDEEGREECERAIQTRKDWVVWKAKRSKKVQGEPVAEEGMEEEALNSEVNVSGRASGKKGGGSVGSWKLN